MLAELAPQGYDHILLIASERLDVEEEADAHTVFTRLMLEDLFPAEGPRPHVLVELLSPENEFLLPRGGQDVIVSPMVVSYMLSQAALRPELSDVFTELCRSWGAQICLHPAAAYLGTQATTSLETCAQIALRQGDIFLGCRRARGGLELNPDLEKSDPADPADEIVVLSSFVDPRSGAAGV